MRLTLPDGTKVGELEVPGDGNCLYTALLIAMLLPYVDYPALFNKYCKELLGIDNTDEEHAGLLPLLKDKYDGTEDFIKENLILEEYSSVYLRPKLVQWMKRNKSEFQGFLTDEEFKRELDIIQTPTKWAGDATIAIVRKMFSTKRIHIYMQQNDALVELHKYNDKDIPPDAFPVYLIYASYSGENENNHYRVLMDFTKLPKDCKLYKVLQPNKEKQSQLQALSQINQSKAKIPEIVFIQKNYVNKSVSLEKYVSQMVEKPSIENITVSNPNELSVSTSITFMPDNLNPLLYQNYLRCKESLVLSELFSLCEKLDEILSIQDPKNYILLPESIMNLSAVGYESYKAYALIWRVKYLGDLISQLSWRDGGCKDNNKDIFWEGLVALGNKVEELWKKQCNEWKDFEIEQRKIRISDAEDKLIVFLKNILLENLRELKMRLQRIITKEHLHYLNFPKNGLSFSLERPQGNVAGFRTKSVVAGNTKQRWYETSSLVKTCFFPDEKGEAPVLFKREDAKAESGLEKIREFIEPILDKEHILAMLKVLENIKSFKPDEKPGKEAILMACQMLGEYSHSLSDSLHENLPDLVKQFPFESIREMRNAIKLSVSHRNKFTSLKETLKASNDNNQIFLKIKAELMQLEFVLREMSTKIEPYLRSNLAKEGSSKWKVSNSSHFQPAIVPINSLDKDAKEILDIFDKLSKKQSDPSIQEARVWLEKILSFEFPYLEILNERKEIVKKIGSIIDMMCGAQFTTGTSEHKAQISKDKKRITRLLEKRITDSVKIPLSKSPKTLGLTTIDSFCNVLNQVPAGQRLVEKDYVESYLELIFESIEAMIVIIGNFKNDDIKVMSKLIDENAETDYAIKFYITIVGQLVRSLEKSNLFTANAEDDLLQELFSFRWVRNNEMHNMNQPVGESLLRWYGEQVNPSDHKIKSSEISAYVHHLREMLSHFKVNIDEKKTSIISRYLISCIEDDLKNALENGYITYIVNVDDVLWLSRDQVRMMWKFFTSIHMFNMDVVLFASERPKLSDELIKSNTIYLYKEQKPVERKINGFKVIELPPIRRSEGKWTCIIAYSSINYYSFNIQEEEIEQAIGGISLRTLPVNSNDQIELASLTRSQLILYLFSKEHLEATKSYLFSKGLQSSNWVSLHNLHICHDQIHKIAKESELNVIGIDGAFLSKQWDTPLLIDVKSNKNMDFHKQKKQLAIFRRRMVQLLGKNIKVEVNPNELPRFDLTKVVNSYRLFKYIQYNTLSLKQIQNFFNSVNDNIDVNFYVEGYTVLHTLRRNYEKNGEYIAIANYLITQKNADPNLLDKHGDTILHESAKNDDVDYCKFLIGITKVNVNLPNRQGKLPIEVAAEHQSKEIISILLPYTQNLSSKQHLMIAIKISSIELAQKTLQTCSQDANNPDIFGDWPIFEAIKEGSLSMLKLLVSFGANPKITLEGNTLLHALCESEHPAIEMLEYLVLECKLDVNAIDRQKNAPLHRAASCHHLDLVRMLLKLGADPKLLNEEKKTALHCVAQCVRMNDDAIEIARSLIDAGVSLRQQDNSIGTILHKSALENHIELARLLLSKDISLLGEKNTGNHYHDKTPLEIAELESHSEMVSLFQSAQLEALTQKFGQFSVNNQPHNTLNTFFKPLTFDIGRSEPVISSYKSKKRSAKK